MFQFVSPVIEGELISHCLYDTAFLEKVVAEIPADNLGSNIVRRLYIEVTGHYKAYGKTPDKIQIVERVKDISNANELEATLEIIDRVWDSEAKSTKEAVFNEVRKKNEARKLADTIARSGKFLREGRVDEVKRLLTNQLDELLLQDQSDHTEIEVASSVKQITESVRKERDNPKGFTGVPTGIKNLDLYIKGLLKAEFMLFVAKTAGYKSTVMTAIAANAFLSGRTVAMFVIESPARQYALNVYSYITGVSADSLLVSTASESDLIMVENKLASVKSKRGGRLILLDYPQGLTPTVMQMKLRDLKRRYGHIDLAVLDYLQIMEIEGQSILDMYDWKSIAIISRLLKGVARAENIPIITAAQVNANKKQNEDVHSTDDIAFSKAIGQNVDFCFKIVQDAQDKMINQARMYALKIRRRSLLQTPILLEPKMDCYRFDQPSAIEAIGDL